MNDITPDMRNYHTYLSSLSNLDDALIYLDKLWKLYRADRISFKQTFGVSCPEDPGHYRYKKMYHVDEIMEDVNCVFENLKSKVNDATSNTMDDDSIVYIFNDGSEKDMCEKNTNTNEISNELEFYKFRGKKICSKIPAKFFAKLNRVKAGEEKCDLCECLARYMDYDFVKHELLAVCSNHSGDLVSRRSTYNMCVKKNCFKHIKRDRLCKEHLEENDK
jgi:hypothetical protein